MTCAAWRFCATFCNGLGPSLSLTVAVSFLQAGLLLPIPPLVHAILERAIPNWNFGLFAR